MKKLFALILAVLMVVSCMTIVPITASAAAWDGSTATAPAGLGTKDDPYLIESAANLKWLAASIPQGDKVGNEDADVLAGKYGPAFDGVYFKQTKDIDLNGKNLSSIGYYYSNASRMAAFGGEYDGQGFRIYNGNITAVNSTHDWLANYNWGHGLFGMVYGGTVKNVTLDNVVISGYGITGGIVGRAIAPANNTSAEFNVIENCHLTNSVSFNLGFPKDHVTEAGTTHIGTDKTPGRLGGIVGMAYGTTVANCTVASTISYYQSYSLVGGIVGTAGFNCVVEYCAFTGALKMDNSKYPCTKDESANGGIVGFISPFSSGSVDKTLSGTVKILNCYNSGSFKFLGTSAPAKSTYWGGILGGINSLNYVAPTVADPYPFLMENCYNSYAFTFVESLNNLSTNWRVGGLLGSSYCASGATVSTLWIKNSASVDVDEKHYNGTNEYRQHGNSTKDGYHPVEPVKVDSVSTVSTKTANEMATAIAAIDAANTTVKNSVAQNRITGETYTWYTNLNLVEGKRLTAAVKPAGSGTAEDPYLVACAENLVWMGNTIISLNNEKNVVTNPFKDTYFLQVCDIDLGGKAIYAIGYYFSDDFETAYSVFGGNYNGQGFAIKNGYVIDYNEDHSTNQYWAGGLFGVIYGATIENVNLKDVASITKNLGGVLVGRAAPAKDAAPSASFNTIRNCSVDADCYVQNRISNTNVGGSGQTSGFRLGGIVGMAESVTIENCTNNANIYGYGVSAAAGIAGTLGHATTIRGCVNNGVIAYQRGRMTVEIALGGIAGSIVSDKNSTGSVLVENCYNTGYCELMANNSVLYYGGILGGANSLAQIDGVTYTVQNCYSNPVKANTYMHRIPYVSGDARIGSVIGCVYVASSASVSYVTVADCYGTAATCKNAKNYPGYGVINIRGNTSANATAPKGALVKVGQTTYNLTETAQQDTLNAATVLSAADVAAKITAANITGATGAFVNPNGAVVGNLGVQEHDTESTVRFVVEIDKTVTSVAFDIIASYNVGGTPVYSKLNHFDCKYVYETINAAGELISAPAGKYFALVKIDNIPTDRGDVTFYVTPSVVKDEETLKGATLIYTYDKTDLGDLAATNVGGAAPVVGYNPNAVGAVNVAEMLQKKLASMGANATLAENGNIVFNVAPAAVEAGTWSIATSNEGILVVSDTAYGLIAAYEYMLPKLGLATDLTDAIPSASGEYALDTTAANEIRVMYHNIFTYSYHQDYTVLDRADLMLLTYKAYQPDVIGLQEAGKGGANFATSEDFAELRAWLDANYVKYQAANNSGNPIYVKKNTFTVEESGYAQGTGGYGTQYVVLTKGGKTFAVANLHFEASSIYNKVGGESGNETVGNQARYENGQKLIALVKTLQTTYSCPVVVGGDFNSNLYSSPVGLELTMGTVAAGSDFIYKHLVKYSTLDEAEKANYQEDPNGYAYSIVDEKVKYLTGTASTAENAGNFDAVRHIALDYVDSATTHGMTRPEQGDTRYETVTSIGSASKDAIDHVLYKACGENTITFNQYKVVDDCFALTSSDHAPHYVDIVLD